MERKYKKKAKQCEFLALVAFGAGVYFLKKDYEDYIGDMKDIITRQGNQIGELEQFIVDNVVGYEFPDIF